MMWPVMEDIQEQRFWRKVKKGAGCWEWIGSKNRVGGYGQIRVEGRLVQAHRFSFELHGGKLPPNMRVLHKCDNPSCVNPAHIYAGSQSENVRDAWKRSGRVPAGFCLMVGEDNYRAKLTDEKVRQIRSLADEGFRHEDIAVGFGVHQTTVSAVVRRVLWKHID